MAGLFPVLADMREVKGGGEGSSYNKDTKTKKNKNTKKFENKLPHSVETEIDPGGEGIPITQAEPSKSPVVSDYPEIDKVVHELYDIFTRDPDILIQIQIDRYLFAASAALVAECGGDMRMCVLYESQVPSIFKLPDIIYILRQRLVQGSWTNAMQETVCRYSIPGMQKSRWVSRSRKGSTAAEGSSAVPPAPSVDDADDPLAGVYIHILLGLLLGLYPRCSKRPGFVMRVRIVRTIRALLCSSIQVQTAFITRHVSLVRLAMVEYFANVLELYCPVEFMLLQKHVDVDAYVNLCRSSCDIFRVNNLSEDLLHTASGAAAERTDETSNKPLDWERLDQLAYKTTDKIIRSTRVETKLVNHTSVYHKSIKKLVTSDVYKHPESCDEFLNLVKGCAVACWHEDHSYMYQRMLAELHPGFQQSAAANGGLVTGEAVPVVMSGNGIMNCSLDLNLVVSDIHSVINATLFPANIVRAQVETLRRLYKFDPVQLMVRPHPFDLYSLNRLPENP
jgi:hypothetical protein